MFERLAIVRQDKTKQEELLAGGGFRGSTVPVIRELISDAGSQTSKMVEDSYTKIQGALPAYKAKVRQLQSLTPQLRHAGAVAEIQQVGEAADMEDVVGAEQSRVREALTQAHQQTGWGLGTYVTRKFEGMLSEQNISAADQEGEATKQGIYALGRLKELAEYGGVNKQEEALIKTLERMQVTLQQQLDAQLAQKNQLSAAGANAQASLHKE